MAEASFAQTFLGTLDSRPVKLSPDHVEDPRNFPSRGPYTLPRMPRAMTKPTATSLPGQERSIKVTIKSLRNPPLDISLTSQPLTTSILDIKSQVTAQTRIPTDKMKILHNKKPVSDSKVLKELLGGSDLKAEFSVMVIGGAAAIPQDEQEEVKAEPTGAQALETPEFWGDLKGFLMQRLKDEEQAEQVSALFKTSWESSRSKP